ncbi:T9SS type A sorting domain-containing protein [Candidatus Fermentibacterales bacterium]|nr:T9SS type A sorting domain-containing protein [Candidatus Fermentibacterales bacterium]
MKLVWSIPVVLACTCLAADRVVLLEDFTNCGCGPCWSFEPTLNSFISSHPGQLSVVRPHVWWPTSSDPIYTANPTEQTARVNLYSVNGVPWIQFDGVIHATNSASGLTSAFSSRMAVPSYLQIGVSSDFSNDSGILRISLIAEQDLGDSDLRLHCILVENDVPGEGYWAGSYFEQAFRDNLCGADGQSCSFGSAYPDTVSVEVPYATSSWVVENLYVSVFVQNHTGSSKEVKNAWFGKLSDLTGVADRAYAALPSPVSVAIFPNPCTGTFTITADLPEGTPATLRVFDLCGRLLSQRWMIGPQQESLDIGSPGVFLIRIDCDGETISSERVVVIP